MLLRRVIWRAVNLSHRPDLNQTGHSPEWRAKRATCPDCLGEVQIREAVSYCGDSVALACTNGRQSVSRGRRSALESAGARCRCIATRSLFIV